MWLLKNIELLNFGGLKGGLSIEFRDGVSFIRGRNCWAEGDSNGTLKTTILNAFCWCLYGRTPKGATKFEVINRYAQTARVVVEFGDLSITRTISESGERLEFTHLGLLHSSIAPSKRDYRLREVQGELNKYLGIDFTVFCNAIFVGPSSKTMKFLSAEPGERAKMLSVLVNAEVFSTAADLIKDAIKERNKMLEETEMKLDFCLQRDLEVDDDLETLQKSLSEMEEKNKKREQYVLKEKKRIKREFETAKEALNKTPGEDMEALSKERTKLQAFISQREREIYSAKIQLKKLGSFDESGKCPTCTQPVTDKHIKDIQFIKETLQERLESWEIDVSNATEELGEVESLMEQCREEHKLKVNAQRDIEALRAEMQLVKDQTFAPDMGPVKSMIKEKTDYKAKNLEQIKLHKKTVKSLKEKIKYLERGKILLGSDIRNFMFDSIRNKLALFANDYLSVLAGDGYSLSFPIDTKREKFEISILKGGLEAPRSTLSEGEEWRIKIALVLAFRSILMENVATKYGVFLLDDALGEVDEKGFEKFHELVGKEKSFLLKQVIATVPKDNLIRGADQVLTVTRKPNNEVEAEYSDEN